MAAVYAHGLAKNHPFLGGNKRTALVVALVFLDGRPLLEETPRPPAGIAYPRSIDLYPTGIELRIALGEAVAARSTCTIPAR